MFLILLGHLCFLSLGVGCSLVAGVDVYSCFLKSCSVSFF